MKTNHNGHKTVTALEIVRVVVGYVLMVAAMVFTVTVVHALFRPTVVAPPDYWAASARGPIYGTIAVSSVAGPGEVLISDPSRVRLFPMHQVFAFRIEGDFLGDKKRHILVGTVEIDHTYDSVRAMSYFAEERRIEKSIERQLTAAAGWREVRRGPIDEYNERFAKSAATELARAWKLQSRVTVRANRLDDLTTSYSSEVGVSEVGDTPSAELAGTPWYAKQIEPHVPSGIAWGVLFAALWAFWVAHYDWPYRLNRSVPWWVIYLTVGWPFTKRHVHAVPSR